MESATIGLDIAKTVFQIHGVDAEGRAVLRRKVKRTSCSRCPGELEPGLIGIEACATAHYWARPLQALGHEVRLMPPAYVKAYVKRNRNDAADAGAICEAVTRPTMALLSACLGRQSKGGSYRSGRPTLRVCRCRTVPAIRWSGSGPRGCNANPVKPGIGRTWLIQRASRARHLDEVPIHRHHHGQPPFAPREQAGHINEPDQANIVR